MDRKVKAFAAFLVAASLIPPLAGRVMQARQSAAAADSAAVSELERSRDASLPPGVADAPPLLTAENLRDTTWAIDMKKFGRVTVTFKPDGTLDARTGRLPMAVKGSWSVDGAVLAVTVVGRNVPCRIAGDKIYAEGKEAQRVK